MVRGMNGQSDLTCRWSDSFQRCIELYLELSKNNEYEKSEKVHFTSENLICGLMGSFPPASFQSL
jgi:hypothetical protein